MDMDTSSSHFSISHSVSRLGPWIGPWIGLDVETERKEESGKVLEEGERKEEGLSSE